MPRNPRLIFDDIEESIGRIHDYLGNDSLDDFSSNHLKIDAVLWNLEKIGEASKNVPEDIKQKYAFVEWRKITDFRNILAHEYFGIDIEIVWDIIKNKLPELLKSIQAIIQKEFE